MVTYKRVCEIRGKRQSLSQIFWNMYSTEIEPVIHTQCSEIAITTDNSEERLYRRWVTCLANKVSMCDGDHLGELLVAYWRARFVSSISSMYNALTSGGTWVTSSANYDGLPYVVYFSRNELMHSQLYHFCSRWQPDPLVSGTKTRRLVFLARLSMKYWESQHSLFELPISST